MRVRKTGIVKQIFWTLMIIVIIGIGGLGVVIYNNTQALLMSQIKENAMNLAQCAAANLNVKRFMKIQEGDEESELFEKVSGELRLFLDNSNMEYIYTLRQNSNGEIVFAVDADPEEPAAIGEECEATESMLEAFSGVTSVDKEPTSDEWGTYISAFSPVFSEDEVVGVVGVDISYDWILQQTNRILKIIVASCAVIVVVILAALMFIRRKLNHGFITLHEKVCELADGSGDINKEVILESGDEFEVIAGDINSFILQVRNLVHQVGESTGTNSVKIRHINDNIMDISSNMEECSATTESVSVNLMNTAEQMQGLADEMRVVEKYVHEAGKKAEVSTKVANERQEEAIQMIEQMKLSLERAAADTKNVELIAAIANKVSDFALETRILSLNAQVEAGRAGESGRGFAVVASSIEELSDKIANATNEINEVNKNVIHAVKDLNKQMDEMNEYMAHTVIRDYNTFADMGEYFSEYTTSVQRNIEELSLQSEDIARVVSEANISVQNINQAVYDTAKRVERLSGNSADIATNMTELANLPLLKAKK